MTVDDVSTSATHVFPSLATFATPSGFGNQHIPTQSNRNPNHSPSRGEAGVGARKRRASEALPPKPSRPQKMHKVGKGNGVGGPGATKPTGKSKKRKNRGKKRKANLNSQPGPSNLSREERGVEGDEVDGGHAYEDGEVYGGFGSGDEPDHNPAYPHWVD